MQCTRCQGDTFVLDSRARRRGDIWRRRQCLACAHRFSTNEVLAESLEQAAAPLVAEGVERALKAMGLRGAILKTALEKAGLEVPA